jgi:hypothetical protein
MRAFAMGSARVPSLRRGFHSRRKRHSCCNIALPGAQKQEKLGFTPKQSPEISLTHSQTLQTRRRKQRNKKLLTVASKRVTREKKQKK